MEESYRKMWLMEVKHGHEQCSHIIELEQLCRDMYGRLKYHNDVHDRLQFDDRMDALGLLEGGDND